MSSLFLISYIFITSVQGASIDLESALNTARQDVMIAISQAENIYQQSLQNIASQYQSDSRVQSLQCLGVFDVKHMLTTASGSYGTMTAELYNDYLSLSNRINENNNKLSLGIITKNQYDLQLLSLQQDVINFRQKYINLLQGLSQQFTTTYSGAQQTIDGFVANNTQLLNILGSKRQIIEGYVFQMRNLDKLIKQSAVIINGVNSSGTMSLLTDVKNKTKDNINIGLDRTIQEYKSDGYIGLSFIAAEYKKSLISDYLVGFDEMFVNTSSGFIDQPTINQLKAVETIIRSQFYSSGSLDCAGVMTSSLDLSGLILPMRTLLDTVIQGMSSRLESLQSPVSLTAYRKALGEQLQTQYAGKTKELQKKMSSFLFQQTQGLTARAQLQEQTYKELLLSQQQLATMERGTEGYNIAKQSIIDQAVSLYSQVTTRTIAEKIRAILRLHKKSLRGETLLINKQTRNISKALSSYLKILDKTLTPAAYVATVQQLYLNLQSRVDSSIGSSRGLLVFILDDIKHALTLTQ